jgi:trehalose/maltose transport system substrate-binding protein
MKCWTRWVLVCAVTIAVGVGGFAYSGAAAPPVKVKMILMTGQESIAWTKLADEYKKETGREVVVEGQGRGEYHSALPTQLFGKSTGFDLFFMLDTWLAEFAKAGVVEPLDKYVAAAQDYNASDLLPVGVYQGKRYLIPVDYSHFYLYYRSDLIQNPPQTWDEAEQVARRFSESTTPNAPTKYGITGDYITGEVLPQTWLSILWSMGGDVLDKNGKVVVNSNKAIEAANVWARWAKDKLVPPNITQVGWNDQIDQFVNGTAAMILPGWNAAFYSIPDAKGKYSNTWKAALLPGARQSDGSIKRVIYAQSWSVAINAYSLNKGEAAKFLLWGSSKRGMELLAQAGGMPSRKSVLSDSKLQDTLPVFKLALASFPYVRYAPVVPYWSKIFEALDVALADILNQRADTKSALDETANRINRAIRQ